MTDNVACLRCISDFDDCQCPCDDCGGLGEIMDADDGRILCETCADACGVEWEPRD